MLKIILKDLVSPSKVDSALRLRLFS